MPLFFLVSMLIFAVSVIFALENTTMVMVRFLPWQFSIQITLLILVAFFAGFMSNLLISFSHRLNKHKRIRQNEKKIKKMEEELVKYRNLLLGSRNK